MDRDNTEFVDGWFSFKSIGWGLIKTCVAFSPLLFIQPVRSLTQKFVDDGIIPLFRNQVDEETRKNNRFYFRSLCYYGIGFGYAATSRFITCSPRTFGVATAVSFSISAGVLTVALASLHKNWEGVEDFRKCLHVRICAIFGAIVLYALVFLFYAYVPALGYRRMIKGK